MAQPWIHKARTDGWFILAPTFIVLGVVLLWHEKLALIQQRYSFYTWLLLIVFIDVAHVYATLFKTYFVSAQWQKRRRLFLGLPVFCLAVGMLLFSFGSTVFWSVLAYVAVFHFIRQQYGFMRLYARYEPKTKWNVYTDNLTIYAATGYPMLFWFLSPARQFNWFMPDEFARYENQRLLDAAFWMYLLILLVYAAKTSYAFYKTRYFNLPKNAIVLGTALSWYFGIVYFDNDLIFTMLNVVSHGIPYMGLIYLREIAQKSSAQWQAVDYFKRGGGLLLFIGILLALAFSEEYLWEILVWNEHFEAAGNFSYWQFLLVPLLTVPQFTHYLLDGFIWKSPVQSPT